MAADRIDLSYVRDPDLDTPLTRSAMPVLRHLREHLDGQPISIILTDQQGVVLSRLTADRDLDRHLDSVRLAPGFSYAEEFVGTNGIGTALEGGRPMHVFGHEHYAEHLEDLACAGVPIQHPISGRTVGAVDLTCWRKDAGPLLVALAKTTADQIRLALLTDSRNREFGLLQEYLRTCRRTAGIVFAINGDTVMMNEHARRVLDPADQSVLLARAGESLAGNQSHTLRVELPTGLTARMYCRPVLAEGQPAGGVMHVKLIEPAGRPVADTGGSGLTFVPGLVGSAPLWLRACHQVETAYDTGEWLALVSEPGAGKLAVVRAVLQRRRPAGRLRVLDAAQAIEDDWLPDTCRELREGEGAVVIQHVDRLDAQQLRVLAAELAACRAAGRQETLWVAVTLTRREQDGHLAEVLRFFPGTVEVPPLRHHIEDLHDLVPFFLSRAGHDGRLVCSPEAMQFLLRYSWPGNTAQLRQVLRWVAQHRRTGVIHPHDLPPECWTVSRRLLSPLESMERDAIVRSLLDFDGSKVKAAESLGISRATIYRKIHEYGIIAPNS
ncbi:Fis family transcriptional regulator [Rugosimonospora africana]|uniref:Fis family transcriptional regulator n=1 Tax=Rugosimonospora africana TaxID=556532 RepID=A0A8J3VWM9_9ACTN|nr:Fis family transcriptional regulator [Rugosimonospora africana]